MLHAVFLRVRRLDFLLLLGVLLAILGAKFVLIRAYGSDLPFWDQWDGEGDALFIHAGRSQLTPATFFQPHNEHRIVFTKLLSFALEKLDGQWDARLEMTANAFVHLAAITTLLLALRSAVRPVSWRVGCFVACVLFALPFAWENTLGGFQSQFYFLELFSILHLAGTFRAERPAPLWAAQLAGVCAVFAMGSGFFSALAIVLVIGLQALRERTLPRKNAALLVVNIGIVALGALLHTHNPTQDSFHVQNVAQFVSALAAILAWPSSVLSLCWLGLIPLLVVVVFRLRSNTSLREHGWFTALIAWWALQVLATVIARGNAMVLSSRYFDLFSIGVVAMAIAWVECLNAPRLRKSARAIFAFLGLVWLAIGISGAKAQWTLTGEMYLNQMPQLNDQRETIVRDFVEHGGSRLLDAKPFDELPYPNADRLAYLLSEPAITSILPPSVRLQTGLAREQPPIRQIAEGVLISGWSLLLIGLALQLGALAALGSQKLQSLRARSPAP